MSIRVVQAPEPIVTPGDVPGEHEGDDATIKALIAAAIEELDGPTGMLQRAIGPQTLEVTIARAPLGWCEPGDFRLPMPPLIAVQRIVAVDEDGDETEIDSAHYRVRGIGTDEGRIRFKDGWPAGADEVRIRFRAGYDGDTTEAVPARVKRAVVLGVATMQALGRESLHLRAEEFDGIGRQEFTTSDAPVKAARQLMSGLVAGLRVFR